MTYAENLWLFFGLLFGIVVIPGLDMLFVMTNALSGGKRAGFAATGGIMLGGAINTLIGAAGVSLILGSSPAVFAALLLAGGLYMAWIGISLVRSTIVIERVDASARRSHWSAFRQGAVTCLLNPKAHMFVIAVLPHFIKPAYGPIWLQALVLLVMTSATQLAVYGAIAVMADQSRNFLVSQPNITKWIARVVGTLFLATAVATLAQVAMRQSL